LSPETLAEKRGIRRRIRFIINHFIALNRALTHFNLRCTLIKMSASDWSPVSVQKPVSKLKVYIGTRKRVFLTAVRGPR